MNAGAILYIDFVAHPNEIDIAPNHGVEPDTAIITHDNISHDRSIGSNETIVSEAWILLFHWKYDRHGKMNNE